MLRRGMAALALAIGATDDGAVPVLPPSRTLSLTGELVARTHRVVPHPSAPPAGLAYLDDEDYRAITAALMAEHDGGDLWLFVYGSLLWKPTFAPDAQEPATLRGWHRRFCLRLDHFRGTPDRPGLMMALDRGGACRGVVQRIPAADRDAVLHGLLRREMVLKPAANVPRWVSVPIGGRPRRALAFVAERGHPIYVRPSLEQTVEALATACGHIGSCAEYLHRTVAAFAALGVHDSHLWQLQHLVAERIAREESASLLAAAG